MKKLSRMEANREVRRVLNKFHVDLSQCSYSVGGREIRLTGYLCKLDSSEFISAHVEGMIQEFIRRMPAYLISGDFENWRFTSEYIANLKQDDGIKKKVEIGAIDEEDVLADTDQESEAS